MARDTDPDDGFLTRWSRRKREVAAEARATEVQGRTTTQVPGLPANDPSDVAQPDPLTVNPEPEPLPELIEPPSLDLVDKDFDLAHWLKQNVPESWKLAALRRTWETDPFIHGYLNPARDYALDWNTPGGAPGYGPLTESDDVKAMLSRIFGNVPAEKEATADTVDLAQAADSPEAARLSNNTGHTDTSIVASQQYLEGDPMAVDNAAAQSLNPVRLGETAPARAPSADAASQQTQAAEPLQNMLVSHVRRRGGGAIPI